MRLDSEHWKWTQTKRQQFGQALAHVDWVFKLCWWPCLAAVWAWNAFVPCWSVQQRKLKDNGQHTHTHKHSEHDGSYKYLDRSGWHLALCFKIPFSCSCFLASLQVPPTFFAFFMLELSSFFSTFLASSKYAYLLFSSLCLHYPFHFSKLRLLLFSLSSPHSPWGKPTPFLVFTI